MVGIINMNIACNENNKMPLRVIPFSVHLFALWCAVLLFLSCSHGPAPIKGDKLTDPGKVSFQGTATNIFEGAPTLSGRLKRPGGNGPFPAIVLLHGCGGINARRDHRWAERLMKWGYVTLQVDSFGPRGLSNVCTYSVNDTLDVIQKRVNDAYDAQKYLAGLPFVDPKRIAVMGWSHGGSTAIQACYQTNERPFQAAVAFYPNCRWTLTGMNAPLLILIGEADDWTPAGNCVSRMPRENTTLEVKLKVYPGAFHGFDTFGANAHVRGSRGTHRILYQQEAAVDSIFQVKDFLVKHLK
jgi:dienelactone hydrolase